MSLEAISPIDGRYREATAPLAPYYSEGALIRYRVIVEGEYLIALSGEKAVHLRSFTRAEKKRIRDLYALTSVDAQKVKGFESVTNHDVKAVEYFLKEKLKRTPLAGELEWIHFALTSEDINNLAYALMLGESLRDVIIPQLDAIHGRLTALAVEHRSLAMLARTHGQPASPTTAYPRVDWRRFTTSFITRLNEERSTQLVPNLITTQIEPHDTYAELFDLMRRINTILIDFNQDMWRYVSDGWMRQKIKEGEVGSSAMPHKVNPIDFENSEGNLGVANALFTHFSVKLPIARLQRDLSDSTVERNFGTGFAHCLVAYHSLLKGLGKITPHIEKISADLDEHQEVVAEAIQTILRREGSLMPYEALRVLTRGKHVTREDFEEFIAALDISKSVKKELLKISPRNYIGLAQKLAQSP